LRHIADAAVQAWVPRAIARNVDLGFVLDNAPVQGNPLLMAELLNNLIDNAIRYTPAGGTVTVRSGVEQGRAYLSVEDNGAGIPEHARDKVFERFFRVEGTPGDGAGLGLAIVKEVADRHHGALNVRTAGVSGTLITATFPASKPGASGAGSA
jgi:two-component system sensor histidine kinase TctE